MIANFYYKVKLCLFEVILYFSSYQSQQRNI